MHGTGWRQLNEGNDVKRSWVPPTPWKGRTTSRFRLKRTSGCHLIHPLDKNHNTFKIRSCDWSVLSLHSHQAATGGAGKGWEKVTMSKPLDYTHGHIHCNEQQMQENLEAWDSYAKHRYSCTSAATAPKGELWTRLEPSVLARRKIHSHMLYFRFCKQRIRSCSPSTPLPKLQSSSQWQMSRQVWEQAANTVILSETSHDPLCMKHDCWYVP